MLGETAVVAFMTFFATVGPFSVAVMFAAMTTSATTRARRSMAIRGTVVATVILVGFALVGEFVLEKLGISLAALRAAGGILLLLIGIDMAFARHSGGTSTTREEDEEAATRDDISVFPLATPLIAGPGAMGSVVLLVADAEGDLVLQTLVLAMLLVTLVITLVCLLLASKVQQAFGVTGMHVVTRVFGVLLAALAVQFIFDGVAQSGLLGTLARAVP